MVKKEQFLYEKLDTFSELGGLKREVPDFIIKNLNQKLPLRPYQVEAFSRFFYYLNNYPERKMPAHLLFNMATGSGKTMIMAGLILYLYNLGYRNFLFFVNSDNIIKKTKDNFLNNLSNKYLFNNKIDIGEIIQKVIFGLFYNIIKKTKDNFLNNLSNIYLVIKKIFIGEIIQKVIFGLFYNIIRIYKK